MDVLFQSLPYLGKGLLQTLWMAALGIVLGTLVGAGLGVAALSPSRVLRGVIDAYIFLTRGVPILVLMFVPYTAVTVALVFYAGAFYTDVMRGALQAVPQSQTEAAKSLGLSRTWIILDVLLPQALKSSVPPWLNTSIVMVKSTSYSAIVGAWELTYAAKETVERTLATFEIFGAVMLFYFLICYPLSRLARRLEQQTAIVQ